MTPAEMVREFHTVFRLPIADTPALVSANLARARHQLLLSEITEVYTAVLRDDLPGVAQELADCVYVLYGTALVYGIGLDAVLAAVHAANMTKLDENGQPIMREDGKVLKSALYHKPDVAAVLAGQAQGPVEQGRGNGPEHKLFITMVKSCPVNHSDDDEECTGTSWYELEHPAECDRLRYGVRCALDQPGDDRFCWPEKEGEYTISAWSSKSWTDMGWEYDAGVDWEPVPVPKSAVTCRESS